MPFVAKPTAPLQPGREADAYVAVHVMGWHKDEDVWRQSDGKQAIYLVAGETSWKIWPTWSPSTDSRHALQAAGVWCGDDMRREYRAIRYDEGVSAYIRHGHRDSCMRGGAGSLRRPPLSPTQLTRRRRLHTPISAFDAHQRQS